MGPSRGGHSLQAILNFSPSDLAEIDLVATERAFREEHGINPCTGGSANELADDLNVLSDSAPSGRTPAKLQLGRGDMQSFSAHESLFGRKPCSMQSRDDILIALIYPLFLPPE